MSTGHFITRLKFAFHCYKNLYHLHNTGAKIITALKLVHPIFKARLELSNVILKLRFQGLNIFHHFVCSDHNLGHLTYRIACQYFLCNLRSFIQAFGSRNYFAVN